MSLRVATVLYSIAVVAIPISVASKFLLGMTGTTWIDPTLLLALAALLALFPHWGDFLDRRVAAGLDWGRSAVFPEHGLRSFRDTLTATRVSLRRATRTLTIVAQSLLVSGELLVSRIQAAGNSALFHSRRSLLA